jgi:hypothetical protein
VIPALLLHDFSDDRILFDDRILSRDQSTGPNQNPSRFRANTLALAAISLD